jgi:hypothetical protein
VVPFSIIKVQPSGSLLAYQKQSRALVDWDHHTYRAAMQE